MDAERRALIVALAHEQSEVPANLVREIIADMDSHSAVCDERDRLNERVAGLVDENYRQHSELVELRREAETWRPQVHNATLRADMSEKAAAQSQYETQQHRDAHAPFVAAVEDYEKRLQELEAYKAATDEQVRSYREQYIDWRHTVDDLHERLRHESQYHADADRLAQWIVSTAVGENPSRSHVLDLHDRLG